MKKIPIYRSIKTGGLYLGQSNELNDPNGVFEGWHYQTEPEQECSENDSAKLIASNNYNECTCGFE